MDRLLALMLFVYYKYTVHLLPASIKKSLDIEVDGICTGSSEAANAVTDARHKVDLASKQRRPVLVDQNGMPVTSEKGSID